MIHHEIVDTMVKQATAAMERSYSPYSGKKVGACLLASDGTLYTGALVEVASYGLSCSAECTAIFKAVSEHNRNFDAIAIVGEGDTPYVPCGSACQVMAEFNIRDVIMANVKGEIEIADLYELAPCTMRCGKK